MVQHAGVRCGGEGGVKWRDSGGGGRFSGSGPYRHPCYSYTWYTGVSQNNFLWQKYSASNFWKVSSFSPPLCTRTFSQHPLPKNALTSSLFINPGILFPVLFFVTVFHPSLTNANYSCRRIFGTSLLTLFGVSLVLWRRETADNEHSNPVLLPLVPKFTNIWISHLQFLHFQKFLLEVVAIGRKNAG